MLQALADSYEYKPTEKQINYMKAIGVDNPEKITSYDATKKIFKKKADESVLSITQRQHILNISSSLDQLKMVLGRDEIYLDKLTYSEYIKIVRVLEDVDKFFAMSFNHIINASNKYEYGWQTSNKCLDNKMYYLKFYDLMMIDIDNIEKSPDILNEIKSTAMRLNLTIRIYETYNGYHVFITSMKINFRSCLNIGRCFKNYDPYYLAYSFKVGFKIRLNFKLNRNETYVAKYLETYGEEKEIKSLLKLLSLHDDYINNHTNIKI